MDLSPGAHIGKKVIIAAIPAEHQLIVVTTLPAGASAH